MWDMATIESVKTKGSDAISVHLCLSKEEYHWLEGNLERMKLFSEFNLVYETRLVQRGKRESSKYFLMPKDLRKNLVINSKVVCNKMDGKHKDYYIFAVEKFLSTKQKGGSLND